MAWSAAGGTGSLRPGRLCGHWHTAWPGLTCAIVEGSGGRALLADLYDQLTGVLAARPQAIVIPSAEGAVSQAYQALIRALRSLPA